MLKNFFKISIRNLWRNKGFSAIHVLGLSLGIASCLLMMLFVLNELSYDRFHEKADRIVRVVLQGSVQGEKLHEAHVMPPVARTLVAEYPEVEMASRLRNYGSPKLTAGDKTFRNNTLAFVDANFFELFSLPFIKGDPATALREPNTLVISASTARKYFGEADPIGQVIRLHSRNLDLKVMAVMADIPENSHFRFDLLVSMASFPEAASDSWMVSEFFTYLLLPNAYDHRQLEAKLPQVVEKYMSPQLQEAMGIKLKEFQEAGNTIGLQLQPLTDIHLYGDFAYDLGEGGDIRYLYIFTAIALFMLLIACINFMNLATAGASKRAREVGVRKALGAGKRQLIGQFLLESYLLCLLAMLLALLMVKLSLPLFNELAGKQLKLQLFDLPWLLPVLLLLSLLVGLVAGSYPAFFLSAFRPVQVLKGQNMQTVTRDKTMSLRSGLVVFQFIISIGLIIGTLIVYQQLEYIQHKKLGYDKEQVVVLPEAALLGKSIQAFRQQLLQDHRVFSVSTSGYLPAGPSYNNNFMLFPEDDVARQVKTLRYEVDEHYLTTLSMKLIEGRSFSEEYGADSAGIILNQTAVKAFGWGEHALGKTLTHANNEGIRTSYRVIGIVEDFHFRPLHERISPLVMVLKGSRQQATGSLIVKVGGTDISGLLAGMEQQWKKFTSEEPFSYYFLNERYRIAYEAEIRMGIILSVFAGLTIFVACLGLFGLALYTAERRTKEIGIRKILGASKKNIVLLLSKDFIRLILLAILIAMPVAWYFMDQWLQNFAYRTNIRWWVFALAGLGAIAIALLTLSFHAIKAALRNPVRNLRTD